MVELGTVPEQFPQEVKIGSKRKYYKPLLALTDTGLCLPIERRLKKLIVFKRLERPSKVRSKKDSQMKKALVRGVEDK